MRAFFCFSKTKAKRRALPKAVNPVEALDDRAVPAVLAPNPAVLGPFMPGVGTNVAIGANTAILRNFQSNAALFGNRVVPLTTNPFVPGQGTNTVIGLNTAILRNFQSNASLLNFSRPTPNFFFRPNANAINGIGGLAAFRGRIFVPTTFTNSALRPFMTNFGGTNGSSSQNLPFLLPGNTPVGQTTSTPSFFGNGFANGLTSLNATTSTNLPNFGFANNTTFGPFGMAGMTSTNPGGVVF